ncbi:dTDP-4-dehydrorhamnose 3,5-epimerase family protein [uncultured Pseudodesulfovibrio sp.]|uniref:dTDP-4-dehydrorhamnose 3,5-epimerase family protein n=1 Tax=uncultured Pseudodesulfovibrio sp. TaxID=2035858 RepID=UPI0029C628DD|nr:dTDP-4-dehydrorhamnose 3,5-epimerase family protein [uncultured Pseudodesulfovibrio sp.]
MKFKPTPLAGVWEIWPEYLEDERGAFARTSCVDEFRAHGLKANWSQCSISWNVRKYTLRGMHYQAAPYGEHKLVRCTMGTVFDVAVDLRTDSATRYQWHSLALSSANRAALYIPPGVAHGFLTLEEHAEVFYQICEPYQPGAGRGVRWDDPAFGIQWPAEPACIADRDATYELIRRTPE